MPLSSERKRSLTVTGLCALVFLLLVATPVLLGLWTRKVYTLIPGPRLRDRLAGELEAHGYDFENYNYICLGSRTLYDSFSSLARHGDWLPPDNSVLVDCELKEELIGCFARNVTYIAHSGNMMFDRGFMRIPGDEFDGLMKLDAATAPEPEPAPKVQTFRAASALAKKALADQRLAEKYWLGRLHETESFWVFNYAAESGLSEKEVAELALGNELVVLVSKRTGNVQVLSYETPVLGRRPPLKIEY